MDQIESGEYRGSETSEAGGKWTTVVSRKKKRANLTAKNENLKAAETINPKPSGEKNPMVDEEDESNGAVAAEEIEKPAVSWAEAAADIHPSGLKKALRKIWNMDVTPTEIRLLEFIDYLGRAFSRVSPPSQFPWLKMYKLIDVIDLPLSYLPEPVYNTSVNWIDQFPLATLGGFVLWASYCIRYRMAGLAGPPKSHEAIYVVLALVLRRKPIALTTILPRLWKEADQEEDKLPVTVWMMAQASQGDLCLGFYSWVHNLLPLLVDNKDPQATDLILQLVEYILSTPNARPILVNGAAARKGEAPLIPPPSFEILLRLTFPASSAREDATERFEAIYPLLKEVALAGAPPSDPMKLVTQQIFTLSLKLAGEGNPVLAKEATAIALWCVTENIDCCNHWNNLYKKNIEASVGLLKKLVVEWMDHSLKLSSSPLALNQTIKSFRIKNKQSITQGEANSFLYIEADNYCKVISGRLSPGNVLLKGSTAAIIVFLIFVVALLFFTS